MMGGVYYMWTLWPGYGSCHQYIDDDTGWEVWDAAWIDADGKTHSGRFISKADLERASGRDVVKPEEALMRNAEFHFRKPELN